MNTQDKLSNEQSDLNPAELIDVELIRPEEVNRACERVLNKDVRYRLVIDMASLKAAAGSGG